MPELREDQGLHREDARGGGAGEAEEEFAIGDAGQGAGEECPGADLLVAEHSEEFAEAGEGLGEERLGDFDGGVAAGDPSAAVGDDGVGVGAREEVGQEGPEGGGVVGDEVDPPGVLWWLVPGRGFPVTIHGKVVVTTAVPIPHGNGKVPGSTPAW